ncbi:hypothetical protein CY0110_15592 [Crocosphaera chwakensis CCY0110]|uniref:Uncharacterized protein n=1 Tax=Crocosphaera chwakensis CCY0110 TaxID=391612 RepID=A3IHF0_9CHRO|nr:hypothetical protein CY0110_15592 [Crocosphaera chwakensis CCY0110]
MRQGNAQHFFTDLHPCLQKMES